MTKDYATTHASYSVIQSYDVFPDPEPPQDGEWRLVATTAIPDADPRTGRLVWTWERKGEQR